MDYSKIMWVGGVYYATSFVVVILDLGPKGDWVVFLGHNWSYEFRYSQDKKGVKELNSWPTLCFLSWKKKSCGLHKMSFQYLGVTWSFLISNIWSFCFLENNWLTVYSGLESTKPRPPLHLSLSRSILKISLYLKIVTSAQFVKIYRLTPAVLVIIGILKIFLQILLVLQF